MTTLAGSAIVALPARAQQPEPVRRIGVLMGYGENDPEGKGLVAAFVQRLGELGWFDGRNIRVDIRWGAGSVDRMRMMAKELVELQPDVIFAHTTAATAALHRETLTIPIVFVNVSDPIGPGFVVSVARPGGNITGFIYAEASMGGKWVELLTDIAPGLTRIAIMFNPETAPGGGKLFPGFVRGWRQIARSPCCYLSRAQRCGDRNSDNFARRRAESRSRRHAGQLYGGASSANHVPGSPQQYPGDLL
jgi:putative ABC transport system substrate-binding protein